MTAVATMERDAAWQVAEQSEDPSFEEVQKKAQEERLALARRLQDMELRRGGAFEKAEGGVRTLLPLLEDVTPKLTVVLDLDETLVRFREGPIYWRPFFDDLLDSIKDVCEVVLWTASTQRCASRIMGSLDPNGDRLHHHIYRNDLWFTGVPYTKDLTLLNRDMSKVLIIENTPQCVFKNPSNAILVEDYIEPNNNDRHLRVVRDIILGMVRHLDMSSDIDVPDFLASCYLVDTVDGTDHEGNPMSFHLPSALHLSDDDGMHKLR